MNEYINSFDTIQDYNSNINTIVSPSVSYIKDEDRIVIKNKYHAPTEDKTEAKVGDLVFYNDMIYTDDIEGDQPLYMDPKDPLVTMMMEDGTCLGVVVITTDMSRDGTVRVVSLDYMDYNNPDNGSKTPVNMMWGKWNETISTIGSKDKIAAFVPGTTTMSLVYDSYFATDYNVIDAVKSQTNQDNTCSYDYYASNNSMVPTPYTSNGLFNNLWTQNSSSVLSELFNGPSNTDAIVEWSGIDVDSVSTVQNTQTNYPAALCCKLYYKDFLSDVEIDGTYYLPSIAELGMLFARFEEIDFARRAVGYPSIVNTWVWSSSLCSSTSAWDASFDLDSHFGYCIDNRKSDRDSVLAFVAL